MAESEIVLTERTDWPDPLLDVPAVLIHEVLSGQTLIHLPGAAPQPIFVSVLLHGDEDVGLKAVQRLLNHYQGQVLPRAMSVFIGNIQAAAAGVRYLPDQLDYNRVWPHPSQTYLRPEPRLMRHIVQRMSERQVCASIDLHNNSGRNPHYSCVCSLDREHLQLAAQFGPRVMYFTQPKGVQTAAFSTLCPSITCECGPIGDASGVEAAARLLQRLLDLGVGDMRSLLPALPGDVQLFRAVGTWRILPQATLSFSSREESIVWLRPDLDRLNFQKLSAGESLGEATGEIAHCMEVRDENGQDVTERFLMRDSTDNIRLRRSVIPSMLTTSLAAIRQDCVGYFLEMVSVM